METLLAFVVGGLFSAAIYLILCRNEVRFLFGLVLMGNAVNLLILAMGRLTGAAPPLISEETGVPPEAAANALPQALILTAIVIGFAVFAFVMVLFHRAYRELGTLDLESICHADACTLPDAILTAPPDPDDEPEVEG